jgi:hypothetical protein
MGEKTNTLKIGDYVTFKSVKYDSFLTAEGILLEDLNISNGGMFDDCIFCVHLQRQYSAARELNDFLSVGVPDKNDVSTMKYLQALQRSKENEQKLSDGYMRKRMGQAVSFGDCIQLFHVKSGKYLQVIADQLAKTERENLRAVLSSHGDSFSWLHVTPRFKIDREGDSVQSGAEIYLKVAERSNEFIHCADKEPLAGGSREINCSLESSSWKMTIFQSSVDASDKSLLLASQLVYISDPETRSNIVINQPPLTSLNDNDSEVIDGEEQTDDKSKSEWSFSDEIKKDVVLEIFEGEPDSNSLWFIESKSLVQGGPIKWKNEQVRFKHLNSGKYLLLMKDENILGEDEEEVVVDRFYFTTTLDPHASGTLFNLFELNSVGSLLKNNKALQLHHNSVWLERGDPINASSYSINAGRDKQASLNLIINKFIKEPDVNEEEESQLVKENDPVDVFVGVASRNYIRRYYEMTVMPVSDNVGTIWQNADREDLAFFSLIIERTVNFSQGFSISAKNINLEVDKADVKLKTRRQLLLVEQGIIEILLKMINKLIPISDLAENISKMNTKQAAGVSEEIRALLSMGKYVLQKCFSLVYYSIQNNAQNQMYVADHLPTLLAHLGGQPLAGKCVTEMLSNNMELQETKIGTREISIFVDKLRNSKMNSMYLQLLQSCCSCQGSGVDGNQCKVSDMLFSNTNDIIILLHADYAKVSQGAFNGGGLYIPSEPIPGSPIHGDLLITKGLPHLSLNWTTNSIDFSPLGLFGKLSVSVQELYKNEVAKVDDNKEKAVNLKRQSKKNSSLEQKQAVANYFIAELFLGAEMCLDRNYVAMGRLDAMFPYEVLITILKLDVGQNLKSAAARLLMCLHVDRDPQADIKIPILTRTWSDIANNELPVMPFVEANRRYHFALVQQIVADYISGMAGNPWEELSRHMLRLLYVMVRFNFYGSIERLRDVIDPLILVLDRRKVVRDEEQVVAVVEKKDVDIGVELDENGLTIDKEIVEDNNDDVTVNDEAEDEEDDRWQRKVLKFMESFFMLICILIITLIAVGLTVWQSIENISDASGTPLYYIGLVILGIFLIELFLRGYCDIYIRGSFWNFVSNKFNIVDITVVVIDIAFLMLPEGGSDAKYTKSLRLLRMSRMLRILRAARVVSAVLEEFAVVTVDSWQMPLRYSKVPMFELHSMCEAVDILLFAQSVVEDRNLSILLRAFYVWEEQKESERLEPPEVFEQIVEDTHELSLGGSDQFDLVLLDVLMFVHKPLVQGALDVLMAHHSMRRVLLTNADQVQLLVSSRRERQFKLVDSMLQQLERNAETHELWGELETDADYAVNKQTKDILRELTEICRVRCTVLDPFEEYVQDTDIQNLYRNLGCFGITFKVLSLIDGVDDHMDEETGELDEVGRNTLELCLLTNHLVFWFSRYNAKNQELVYEEIDYFLDSLDSEINSHHVIFSMFVGNEKLMKTIPHTKLQDMAEKICDDGKSANYLYLYNAICSVGDRNIAANQAEIMKCLASPGRLQKTALYFCPITHPDYEEKRQLMLPLQGRRNLTLDDLPPKLAYHLLLVDVLSSCTVGRINITSIEAKVQSVFNFIDIIDSMLHPDTILFAKIKLGNFMFNAVMEVEMMIPGLEHMNCVWVLFSSYPEALAQGKDELIKLGKWGWLEAPDFDRQLLDYMLVSIKIIGNFFVRYFDLKGFRVDDNEDSPEKIQISINEVYGLIQQLFYSIKDIHDIDTDKLCQEDKDYIYEVLCILNSKVHNGIVEPQVLKNMKQAVIIDEDLAIDNTLEGKVVSKYRDFLKALEDDETCQSVADNECTAFIEVLEGLPYIADSIDAGDLRYEGLIIKLVAHVRENMTNVNNETRMDARCTKTTAWIIKAFRTMIENRMGMSIFVRDDEGGAEEDERALPVVNALNYCGATTLCLELINVGLDESLHTEAMKLCIGLLFKEGGALEVQSIMQNFLNKNNSELFFKQVRATLQSLISWHNWNGVVLVEEDEEPNLPEDIIIVRFLQLMSEGHYLPNQDLMREQLFNHSSINLLDDLALYLNCLTKIPCRTSTTAAIRVAATILEVLQGPCVGNQLHFSLNTELIETLNRLLRAKPVRDCDQADEIELKKIGIDIFQGLLEGQGLKSQVYERVLSVIHIDVIHVLSEPEEMVAPLDEDEEIDLEDFVEFEEDEDVVLLQTECVVLLQMLCSYKPSLRVELGMSTDISDIVGSGTAGVEIMWRGDCQRRFFHVPNICADLSKSSKDKLVEEVDRSTNENKLLDFLSRSYELYREIKHQQILKEMNLSLIFSPSSQNTVTWISFYLAFTCNLLLAMNYTAESGKPELSPQMVDVMFGLNITQITIALFVLVLSLVVRTPVKYQSLEAEGYSGYEVMFYTATDPLTCYYFGYLLCTIAGLVIRDYLFIPPLLLDIIVKNSTTRDVLNAVLIPRKQLLYTMLISLFAIYIYAFFAFQFFRDDMQDLFEGTGQFLDCATLWGCLKSTARYGLASGGGIGDMMNHSLGSRYLFDLTFFLVILIVALNLVSGIIIMTFSSLREEKAEIMADTVGICFICGIEKQVFDRASALGDGFKLHITYDQNMWNYLYFIIHLWEQDKDDDDGLEQFVRRAIDDEDVSWFPMNKAMCLDLAAVGEEAYRDDLKVHITESEEILADKLASFQSEVGVVLEQLTQKLKIEADLEHAAMKPPTNSSTAKVDSNSLVISLTEEEKEREERAHFCLMIKIGNIYGLDYLSPSEMKSVQCIVTLGDEVQTVKCQFSITGNVMKIIGKERYLMIAEDVNNINEDETCYIKIQYYSKFANEEAEESQQEDKSAASAHDSINDNIKKYITIAEVNVKVTDLFSANGLNIEKNFSREGVVDNSIVVLYVRYSHS